MSQEEEYEMKSIILLTIINIIIYFIINQPYALAYDNCNISISPLQINYGDITSDLLYDQAEKNDEGFILTRYALLEITCINKKEFQIYLHSSKVNNEYFNAKNNVKVFIIADEIQANEMDKEYIIFLTTMEGHKIDFRVNSEWIPGQILEINKPLTKLAVKIKIKFLIPYNIFKNETSLNFQKIFNFLLRSKIKNQEKIDI
ncbi:MAG: hypothetical protein ACTTNT_02370 [Arsenophonus sp.]